MVICININSIFYMILKYNNISEKCTFRSLSFKIIYYILNIVKWVNIVYALVCNYFKICIYLTNICITKINNLRVLVIRYIYI